MIIDVHAHYLPPSYVRALADVGVDRPDGFPHVPRWSPEVALEAMARLGIDAAVLSISSPGVAFAADRVGLARAVNEEGAEVLAAHPRRFALLVSLPLPNVDAALAEIAYASDDLGADGFVLMTNYDGVYVGDPRLDPVLDELNRRGAVVALHPTSPPGWEATSLGRPRPMIEFPIDTTRAVFNLILSGTLERCPQIELIVPHGGSAIPALADRVQDFTRAVAGERIDVHGALRRLWFDLTGGPYPTALASLLTLSGANRLLYGSDVPFGPMALLDRAIADLRANSAFTDEQRRGIFTDNPRRLFPRLAPDAPTPARDA
jgi:predicted TIM-barrel fold metal-dependent hydrolase